MGASCKKSLAMCSNRIGQRALWDRDHPSRWRDLPLQRQYSPFAILDGMSHTIIIMETIDDSNSRWMIGSECVLTGLPPASCPTGQQPHRCRNNGHIFLFLS